MHNDRIEKRWLSLWTGCRLPFLAALAAGLLADGFFLTNKIPVDDDLPFFFGKGATTVSGRWGLELIRYVLPDWSMPWLYGLLSLLALSVCACLIVRAVSLRSRLLQGLIAAVFVSFPAETGTLSYTFTSLPYALALLLAVASVTLYQRGDRAGRCYAPLMLTVSCSIYQGYFAVAASLYVILLLQALVKSDRPVPVIVREGLGMLLTLILAAGLYGLSVLALNRALHLPVLGADAFNNEQGLLLRFALTYSAFLHTFTRGYFAYVRGPLSLLCHAVLLLASLFAAARALRGKPAARWGLTLLGLMLMPPAMYCLYLLAGTGYIHSLALYSFVCVYVLAAVFLDGAGRGDACPRQIASAALCVVLAGNICFANAFSLCSYLEAEQTKSFYTGLITRVQETPGYDESCALALIGEPQAQRAALRERFPLDGFQLPGNNVVRSVHASEILQLYLGWEVPMADEEQVAAVWDSGILEDMAVYPYDGSVERLGNVIVVKLS